MGHKSKTEIINNINEAETVKQLTLATPGHGQVVTGVSLQGDATGVGVAAGLVARTAVEAAIRDTIKAVARAEADKADKFSSFCAAVDAWVPPPDLLDDLTAVLVAVKRFVPDARLAGDELPVTSSGRSQALVVGYSLPGRRLTAEARLVRGGQHAVLNVPTSREYPMPAALAALVQAYEAAEKAHAALVERLKDLRDKLALVPQFEKAAMADVAIHTMKQSDDGKAVLSHVNRQLLARLAAAGIPLPDVGSPLSLTE